MIPNSRRSIELLVDTIAIVFTIWSHIPAANAQPSSPAPATTLEPPPVITKLMQAPSYSDPHRAAVAHGTTSKDLAIFILIHSIAQWKVVNANCHRLSALTMKLRV
jgi:hypothetical protein